MTSLIARMAWWVVLVVVVVVVESSSHRPLKDGMDTRMYTHGTTPPPPASSKLDRHCRRFDRYSVIGREATTPRTPQTTTTTTSHPRRR
jgi:hypothetical protein